MSRFNAKIYGTKTVNQAGGEAYAQSPELALVSILLTSMVNDWYYKSSTETLDDLKNLIILCDPLFVAKATVYARREFWMRSITHVMASELAKYVSGETFAKLFYNAVINRPDDMLEIVSYHKANGNKITNAMKKWFSEAIGRFDEYSLAKYRGEWKDFKLVDLVNLIHPKGSDRSAKALEKLVKGTLKSVDTWEAKLTQAGQKSENDDEKAELKADAWADLILNKKIKYFALLRNLRNILNQAPSVVDSACELLVNEKMIHESLVLPFRFMSAYVEIEKLHGGGKILGALSTALDISFDNVPKFDGKTLVVVDHSASMGSGYDSNFMKGCLFGIAMAKANEADFMHFGDEAQYLVFNPRDTTLTLAKGIDGLNERGPTCVGHGTNFSAIFEVASKKYDRIMIFSDMQGWKGYYTPTKAFNEYKKKFGAQPNIYSFDLTGNGNMQFPEKNVFAISWFSEKIFDLLKSTEQDKDALIKTINAYDMTPRKK